MDNGEHPSRDKTSTGTSIPQIDSRYELSHRIGTGGMGEVYLAEDTELRRKVALKFLPKQVASEPDALARFKREAQAAAALNQGVELCVRRCPEQYQWSYKRFKTRPPGQPKLYVGPK